MCDNALPVWRGEGTIQDEIGGKKAKQSQKSSTRKEYEEEVNSIARRGQGGIPPCRVKGRCLLWGLGQRPNRSTGDQLQGSRPQRRRQRSVPASSFALPQERPPSCSIPQRNIVAPDGRDRTAGLSDIAALSRKQGISPLRRRPKGMKTDECLRSPFGNLRAAHSHVS